MYWTDSGTDKIQRANLDGSNIEDLVTRGLGTPVGIALDVAGGKMYWTDYETSKIQRANLDGSNVQDLITQGVRGPDGIALDVAGGKMYWADSGTGKIQRANLDGSNVQNLVTQGLETPAGIALDVAGGKMYWVDFGEVGEGAQWGQEKIQCANLDGSNVQTLVTRAQGLALVRSIAVGFSAPVDPVPVVPTPSQPFIYWTDEGADKIQRANLDGSNVQDLVTTGLDNPDGIALDVAGGKMYWADFGTDKIQRANLDGSNVQDLVTTGLDNPEGIALDVTGGKMYWTDAGTGKIQRANLDGSNVQDLVTTGLDEPEGIALDVSGGKMYWTDYDTDKIQRANLDGSNVQDLVTTGLGLPLGIALDVTGGKMYWTDAGTEKIQRANLDGTNVQDLVTGLDIPSGIALDVASGKMYWMDRGTDKIQRANLDGSTVQDLVTGLDTPSGIALGISSQAIPPPVREDVNRDRVVDVQDIVYVAQHYGQTGQSDADVNRDGVVNIDDIVLVAAVVDSTPAAPSARSQLPKALTTATVEGWVTEAKLRGNKTPTYQRGILTLEQLLAVLTPEETVLLANYPNPFNPETWIPYHLANDTDVSLSIYDINGALVRELDLGHQRAGYYTDRSRAAYWDGRNEWGERVASGVYFYQFRAGDYLKLRKMVILK